MKRTTTEAPKASFRKLRLRWVMILFLGIFIYEVCGRFVEPRLLPVRHINMNSHCERINLNAIKDRIRPYLKGFFSTNVIALKNDILAQPFVEDVVIKRVWPDTLSISLTELTLVASWGADAALSSRGGIIPVKVDVKKHLPLFIGPDDQAAKILDQYNLLSTLLHPFNLNITELELNSRRSWQIKLNNGIKILLGRKDMVEHLSSFVSIYPKLKKIHGNNIDSIDLRHSNGISVHLMQ